MLDSLRTQLPHRLGSRGVWTLLVVLPLTVHAGVGPTEVIDFRINVASFANLTPPPGQSLANPVRTIQYAANHWAAYGGSRKVFRYLGTTSATDCAGGNVVRASGGLYPGDTSGGVVADNAPCLFGTFVITFYGITTRCAPNCTVEPIVWTLVPPEFPHYQEMTEVAVHEFGHSVLIGQGAVPDVYGHFGGGNNDKCIMNIIGTPGFAGFCAREIRANGFTVDQLTGSGFPNSNVVLASSSPSLTYWSWSELSFPTGSGGPQMVRGRDVYTGLAWDLIMTAEMVGATAAQPHFSVQLRPADNAWNAQIVPHSIQRPVTVFDPVRNAWWTFVRDEKQAGDDTTHNDFVRVYMNIPGISTWEYKGILKNIDGGTDVQTRYPVGAAFDPISSNIVLAWNNGRELANLTPPCIDSDERLGCINEVVVSSLSYGTLPSMGGLGLRVQSSQRFAGSPSTGRGNTGLGSPAIVCDPASNYFQCNVFTTNFSWNKEITEWRVCVDSSGEFCGFSAKYSERATSDGETDFPIGVSPRRWTGAGRVVQAVTGLDFGIWYRSKVSLVDPFPGWSPSGLPAAASGPSVLLGPVTSNYTMTYSRKNN